jgi:hypothetical protein
MGQLNLALTCIVTVMTGYLGTYSACAEQAAGRALDAVTADAHVRAHDGAHLLPDITPTTAR